MTELSDLEISGLRARAERAKLLAWHVQPLPENCGGCRSIYDAEQYEVACTSGHWDDNVDAARATHIATFDPPTVLIMLSDLTALRAEVATLREALATAESEARRYAEHYPQSSDGRNTFTMLADRIASLGDA